MKKNVDVLDFNSVLVTDISGFPKGELSSRKVPVGDYSAKASDMIQMPALAQLVNGIVTPILTIAGSRLENLKAVGVFYEGKFQEYSED